MVAKFSPVIGVQHKDVERVGHRIDLGGLLRKWKKDGAPRIG